MPFAKPTCDVRTLLMAEQRCHVGWYAFLDAAQDREGPGCAAQAGLRLQSLYTGRLGEMVHDVAPHLVAVDLQSPFAEWWLERWQKNCGTHFQSRAPFDELRKHFRRYLMVKGESGKKYRFRFYDPRVLRAFLPACTPEELAQFFGPIERFYTPSRDGQGVLSFRLHNGALRITHLRGDVAD